MTRDDLERLLLDLIIIGSSANSESMSPNQRNTLWGRLRDEGWTPEPSVKQQGHRPGTTDWQLLEDFLAGDAGAFEALVRRHLGRLQGYARRSLTPEQAEEAVHDAFIVLFRKGETLQPDSRILAYLFGVLRNEIKRRLCNRVRVEVVSDVVADTPDESDNALELIIHNQERERLVAALHAVCNPLEQDVILLAINGQRGPDIARALDVSENHVRVLKHRAINKLRNWLAEY